jgi:hypothetical protein
MRPDQRRQLRDRAPAAGARQPDLCPSSPRAPADGHDARCGGPWLACLQISISAEEIDDLDLDGLASSDHVRAKLASMARNNNGTTHPNSHHFAALWPDIEDFASEGVVALTCVNSKKRMAAWGGLRPLTGTNAMAFACPRPDDPPLVWDQSSSVLSQGDVLLAASRPSSCSGRRLRREW